MHCLVKLTLTKLEVTNNQDVSFSTDLLPKDLDDFKTIESLNQLILELNSYL